MKHGTRFLLIYLIGCILGGIGMGIVVTGCNTTQERRTFNTMYSVETTVTAAYSSYIDLVVQGKVPTNDVPRISQHYSEFQQVFGAALRAFDYNHNALPTAEVSSAAARVTSEIASAKGTP